MVLSKKCSSIRNYCRRIEGKAGMVNELPKQQAWYPAVLLLTKPILTDKKQIARECLTYYYSCQ